MGIKWVWFIFFATFLSCNSSLEKTNPVIKNITASVYAAGTIKAKNQYQVFATVNGIISQLFVLENDLVKQGDPLLLIADEAVKYNRENARLNADYAALGANREKLADAKNNISLAETKYRNDSLLFARQQNLWNQGIGSRLDYEQRELAFKQSKTNLASASIKYKDLLRQLEFNEALSKNNLAVSKVRTGDFTVKSEIEGKVYALFKERGEMVNPQVPLAIIGDADSFLLELQIDEFDIVKIKQGQQLLVSMDSYQEQVFEARVSKINPFMNERTKSFIIEAVFVTQPPVLYPNLTVEANIVIETKENALVIPRNYLVRDSFVIVANEEQKAVVTGLKDYREVEIISGLSTSDVIYKPR